MAFDWLDATALFVLWAVQFFVPHLRQEVAVAYAVWIAILVISFLIKAKPLLAPTYFWQTLTQRKTTGRTPV